MSSKTICFVSCVAKKLEGTHQAQDLYSPSTFFKWNKLYAERHADEWFILSAKHHVLRPTDIISKYDLTLKTMKKPERLAWASIVKEQLKEIIFQNDNIIMLAGQAYRENIMDAFADNNVSLPLDGVGGIGSQMGWLKRNYESYQHNLEAFLSS